MQVEVGNIVEGKVSGITILVLLFNFLTGKLAWFTFLKWLESM
jgi:hypothetical protein